MYVQSVFKILTKFLANFSVGSNRYTTYMPTCICTSYMYVFVVCIINYILHVSEIPRINCAFWGLINVLNIIQSCNLLTTLVSFVCKTESREGKRERREREKLFLNFSHLSLSFLSLEYVRLHSSIQVAFWICRFMRSMMLFSGHFAYSNVSRMDLQKVQNSALRFKKASSVPSKKRNHYKRRWI